MAVSVQNDGDHPGEYRRETGLGMVTALERKGRNIGVTINAEHLREDVKAWADSHNARLVAALEAAHAGGNRVAYTIDVHRTRGVDPAIPFADLKGRDKVRDLTDLHPVDGAGNPVPMVGDTPDSLAARAAKAAERADGRHEAATPPQDAHETLPADPGPEVHEPRPESYRQTEARVSAAAKGPHAPCPRCGHPLGTGSLRRGELGLEHAECPQGDPAAVDHEAAAADAQALEALEAAAALTAEPAELEPAADEPPAEVAPPTLTGTSADGYRQPAPPPAPAPRSPRRGRMEEARPWEFYNSDGSINLGSYAVTAAVGMVEAAAALILEHNRTTFALTGSPVEAPTRGQVLGLARRLLEASDRVQANLRTDGRADRLDNSHTRARGAVRSALDLYPVPFGATEEQRTAWLDALVGYATLLLEVSVTLTELAP